MIISMAAEHTSTELLVLLFRGPVLSPAAGLGRRLQDVLGELVQTTAGKWITLDGPGGRAYLQRHLVVCPVIN